MKFLLIVEDKKTEQQKAVQSLATALGCNAEEPLESPLGAQLVFKKGQLMVALAASLEEARKKLTLLSLLQKNKGIKVGVMTDLMFPSEIGGKEAPYGLEVLVESVDRALPVVVCSDTDHHDVGYLKGVFPLIGKAHPVGEIPVILYSKDWSRAVQELLRLL